jgi:hypothetical protein
MMARLITLPDGQKPTSSSNVQQWTPGGVVTYSHGSIVLLNGSVKCENNYNIGAKNTDGDRDGNIYTSSSGFTCNVSTKKTSAFYTNTYIGSTDVSGGSSSSVDGGSLAGGKVNNNTMANWTKNVKGFVCEVSSIPVGSGDSADGSGTTESMGISGVFVDSNGVIKVYEMNNKGTKVFGHDQNSRLPSTWTKMCYIVNSSSTLNLYHMGWIVSFHHYKFQGGNNKTKNCTGRVRYLQPLITDSGSLSTTKSDNNQILMKKRKWSDRNEFQLYTV